MKVLITGGTGSLGEVLVEQFSTNENEVYFTYKNNKEKANKLKEKYGAIPFTINEMLEKEFNFDVVVNNAAISGDVCSIEELSLESFKEVMDVNVSLPFLIIKKALPYMKKNKFGRIINISSVYGVKAEEELSAFCVSKAALIGLTKSVAKEYARYGISCNVVLPGAFESEVVNKIADLYASKEEKDEYFKSLTSLYPAGRLGTPIEISKLVKYLSSEEAEYINGASITIDGGYTV